MFAHWLAIALLQAPQPAPIDLPHLLDELVDRTSIARLPDPAWTAHSACDADFGSSKEANGGIRTIVDVEGPGVLTCIDASNVGARVSIWIDDEALVEPGVERQPTLVIDRDGWPIADALVGAPPRGPHPGGARFVVPLPFAKRARVDVEGPACRVDWRRYAGHARITSFARDDLGRHRSAIARTERELREKTAPAGEDTFSFSLSGTNREGEFLGLGPSASPGPRAVSEIRLRIDGADVSQGLRHCTLRLAFDGTETVVVPLGAFFGSQEEMRPQSTWFVSLEMPGDLVSRWVMPYREKMTMRIDNAGDSALHVAGLVRTIPWTWDERSMHFHATWRAVEPAKPLVITGRGLYVGELAAIASPTGVPHEEAGAEFSVDGGEFRRGMLGGFDSRTFAEPLRGAVRSDPEGRSDAYRFRVLDAIPFATSLRHQHSRAAGYSSERAACVVWYARPGAKSDAPALPRDPSGVLPARRKR